MKLCKDCKHYSKHAITFYDVCTNEVAIKFIEPVRGEAHYETASIMRESKRPCGEEGKLFELVIPTKVSGVLGWIKRVLS